MQLNNQTGRGVFRCIDTDPYIYDAPLQNLTGPERRMLHTVFGKYFWLGEANANLSSEAGVQ